MADIELILGFEAESASIRKVQSDITRALKDTTPEIEITASTNALRNIQQEIQSLNYTIADIDLLPSALANLSQVISTNINVEINNLSLGDRARRQLNEIENELRDALAKVDVQLRLEQDRGRGAVPGRGAVKKETAADAKDVGLSTEGAQLQKQRQEIENKLKAVLVKREIAERQIAEISAPEAFKAQQALSKEFRTQIRAFRQLESISSAVGTDLKSLQSAVKKAEAVSGVGTGIEKRKEVDAARDSLVASLKRRVTVANQAIATSQRLVEVEKELTAEQRREVTENRKNVASLSKLSNVTREIEQGGANLVRALNRAEDVEAVGNVGSGVGEQVVNEQKKLISGINRRIRIQEQADASTQKFIEAENEGTRAQQRQTQANNRNVSILEKLATVRQSLTGQSVNLERALARAQGVEIRGQGGTGPSAETATDLAFVQNDLIQDIKSRIRVQKQAAASTERFIAAELEGVGERRQLSEILGKNTGALQTLENVRRSLAKSGTNLDNALIKASQVPIPVRGQGSESGELGDAVAGVQRDLINDIQSRLTVERQATASVKRYDEAILQAKEAARTYEKALLESKKNLDKNKDSTIRLGVIEDQVARGLTGLSGAIKQAEGIKVLGSTVDTTTAALARLQAEVVGRLTKQKSIADAEQATIEIVKQQEQKQAEINKVLGQQAKALRQRLGISDKAVEQSNNIFKSLSREAEVIAEGQTKTQKAFEFLAAKIREGARRVTGRSAAPRTPRPGAAGGQTVTFRNAADVQSFSDKLNATQLREFALVLSDVASGTQNAQRRLDNFGKTIGKGNDQQNVLNKSLEDGESSAQAFGKQVGIAAKRLLAWAAPANLIFATVSRLRQAVTEIIEIDKQARRLVFFTNAGAIITKSVSEIKNLGNQVPGIRALGEAFNATSIDIESLLSATQKLAVTNNQISAQFTSVANIATAFGLSLRDTTAALLEITRIGQKVTGTGKQVASAFTTAALALIRVEAGALGAAEGVRGLQAIQAQFFGGQGGAFFAQYADSADRAAAAGRAVANASAVLQATAAGSSASVSELVDATTRLGAAFSNIVGLDFAQTVSIIGAAFTATGATTGRLATALRQTATLIAQNASEIKELTGIEVTNADGTLKDFDAIVKVLQEIRKEAGSLQATEIALLIADRRNVADILALAASVDTLEQAFKTFGDPIESVQRVVAASLAQFDQVKASVRSLEGSINNLDTAFVSLVESSEVRDFLEFIVGGVTSSIQVVDEFGGSIFGLIERLKPLGIILAGIALGAAAKQIILFGKGLLSGSSAANALSAKLRTVTTELKDGVNVSGNLNELFKSGLLTKEQEVKVVEQIGVNARARIGFEQKLRGIGKQLSATQGQGLKQDLRRTALKQQEISTLGQIERLEARISRETRRTAEAAERAAKATQRRTIAIRAGVAASFFVAGVIQNEFRDAGQEGIADGIALGIGGAAVGFSAGGPAGALIGAIAGLAFAGIKAGVKAALADTAEEIEQAQGFEESKADESAQAIRGQTIQQLRKTKELFKSLDIFGKDALLFEIDRLREIRKQLTVLDKINNSRGLDESEARRLLALTSALGKVEERIGKVLADNTRRSVGLAIQKKANELLAENEKLTKVIINTDSSALEVVKARLRVEKNLNKLSTNQFKVVTRVIQAEQDALVATEKRQRALEAINRVREEEILGGAFDALPIGEEKKFELKLELDEQAFNSTIRDARARIKILTDAVISDLKTSEQVKKDIATDNALIRQAQTDEITRIFKARESVLKRANSQTQSQIKVWETAAQRVTKAFDGIVKSQKQLAGIFATIGEANAAIIDRTSQALQDGLANSGSRIASQLSAVFQTSQRGLGNARRTFGAQQSTLGARFGSGADIGKSVQNLIDRAAGVISKSDEKILQERRGIVTTEGALSRELARAERADFDRKIGETRREIDIRRKLLQDEITSFQDRFAREKEINELRLSQQQEFGRLLIESPEKFKQQLDSIGTAENFFKGITDVTEESLSLIQRRSEGLRGQGGRGQGALQEVLRGIDAAVQTGGRDIISGIGNRELQQIFTRAQRENTTVLAASLEEQRNEVNSQTEVQREIDARQKELVRLAEFDGTIQQNLLSLAQVDAQLAIKQRDAQANLLGENLQVAKDARRDIVQGLRSLVAILANVPGVTAPGGNEFLEKIVDLGKSIFPFGESGRQAGQIGRKELQTIAEGIQKEFGAFLNRDAQEVRGQSQARKRLSVQVELERKKHIDATAAISRFTTSMNDATNAVGLGIEATKIQTGEGLKNVEQTKAGTDAIKLRNQLRERATGTVAGQSNAIGQNTNRFISDEIRQIKERTKAGGQLTRAERNRLRELERFGRRQFRNDPVGGRQLARRLFRDEGTQGRIVGGLRQTLSDSASNPNEFIDRARRLRGEGARGRRGIDVEETQRFLTGAGFSGAARSISTRGQAADVLDRFIEISKRLAKEQDKISNETKKKIIQVLGDELTIGIKDITNKTADLALLNAKESEKRKKAIEKQQEDRLQQFLLKATAGTVKAIAAPETQKALKAAVIAGHQAGAEILGEKLATATQVLAETKISVDPVQLTIDLNAQINAQIEADAEFERVLMDAFAPVIRDSDVLRKTVRQIKVILIKANFPGAATITPGSSGGS